MTTIDDAWLDRHRVDPSTLPDAPLIGVGHVEQELRSLLLRLSQPEHAARLGAEVPTAVLLSGPAGVGKTHAARSLAKRLDDIPLYDVGAEELTDGDTVRAVFAGLQERHARCALVVDEIDLAAAARGMSSDTSRRTLAALLTALDGLKPATGILVVGTTSQNILDLDPAVVRAGRLGYRIEIGYPEPEVRRALLEQFLAGRPVDDDIDLAVITKETGGWSPAELKAAVADAAGLALFDGSEVIRQVDLARAVGRDGVVHPEPSRKRVPVNRASIRRLAAHEAGHALCAALLLSPLAVRSMSLSQSSGTTVLGPLPGDDPITTEPLMRSRLVVAWSGLAAEQMLVGSISIGSHDDLRSAIQLARELVAEGMEPDIAPIDLTERIKHGQASEEAADRVADLLVAARQRAMALALAHRDALRRLADEIERRLLEAFAEEPQPSVLLIETAEIQALLTEVLAAEPLNGIRDDRAAAALS